MIFSLISTCLQRPSKNTFTSYTVASQNTHIARQVWFFFFFLSKPKEDKVIADAPIKLWQNERELRRVNKMEKRGMQPCKEMQQLWKHDGMQNNLQTSHRQMKPGRKKLHRKKTTKTKAAAAKHCQPEQQHFRRGLCSAVCADTFSFSAAFLSPLCFYQRGN